MSALWYITPCVYPCQSTTGEGTLKSAIETSLATTIQELCTCDFSPANIESLELTCQGGGHRIETKVTLVYSDEEGRITSSTLTKLLCNWVLIEEGNAALTITEGTSLLVTGLQGCDSVYVTEVRAVTTSEDSGDGGAIAGALIGGVFAGGLVVAIPTIIVM